MNAQYLYRTITTHHRRLFWFGLIGVSGIGVNMTLLYLLKEWFGLPTLLAGALATEAAILSNFALNNCWTFRDARGGRSLLERTARYNFFALGGMVISLAVLATLTYGLHLHYLVSNLFATGAAMLWNYIANSRWTWSVALTATERADG